MSETTSPESSSAAPSWRPLGIYERRVAGVLVEKAKTTPDAYPLTLNALRNGCNQKSNRAPVLTMEETQVEDALDTLRRYGAVVEVQGDGRVPKFRHLMYEWLGVEKAEMAVITELLLRGAQTVGELRGRAARMDPIADMAALWPILESLQRKKLVVFLSPRGRGCTVTHALYTPNELEKVKLKHGGGTFDAEASADDYSDAEEATSSDFSTTGAASQAVDASNQAATAALNAELDLELRDLRAELTTCQAEIVELRNQISELQAEMERMRTELGM